MSLEQKTMQKIMELLSQIDGSATAKKLLPLSKEIDVETGEEIQESDDDNI